MAQRRSQRRFAREPEGRGSRASGPSAILAEISSSTSPTAADTTPPRVRNSIMLGYPRRSIQVAPSHGGLIQISAHNFVLSDHGS